MSASEIRARVMELAQARLQAECAELSAQGVGAFDSDEDVVRYRAARVGDAVTQLAVLHGQLYGRNLG
jgi:hypothetical protein